MNDCSLAGTLAPVQFGVAWQTRIWDCSWQMICEVVSYVMLSCP